jgi:hypothetical protein
MMNIKNLALFFVLILCTFITFESRSQGSEDDEFEEASQAVATNRFAEKPASQDIGFGTEKSTKVEAVKEPDFTEKDDKENTGNRMLRLKPYLSDDLDQRRKYLEEIEGPRPWRQIPKDVGPPFIGHPRSPHSLFGEQVLEESE